MHRWKAHAQHILDCIEKIGKIEERGSLLDDDVLYAATLRHLQTLAEATQQIPESYKADEPAIPWRDISGFRNILVHNYLGDIDALTIQTVTREHLPELEMAVRRILERNPE